MPTLTEREIRDIHGSEVQKATEHLRQPGSRWMDGIWQARGWPTAAQAGQASTVPGWQIQRQSLQQQVKSFGRLVQALTHTKGDVSESKALVARHFPGDSWVQRALEASVPTAGGILLQGDVLGEVIEYLRAKEVVRSFNPQVVSLASGTLTINKITGTANHQYVGELQDDEASQLSTGNIVMSRKKLRSLTPISNDLLRMGSGADALVANDLAMGMAVTMDAAMIRANGTVFTPRGLKYWADAANLFGATALAGDDTDIQTVTDDLNQAILNLSQNNILMDRPGWIMAPRSKQYLQTKYSANAGVLIWGAEMNQSGTLLGIPFRDTTSIPVNLGGGGDQSEVYLVEFSHVIIGDASNGIILDTSTEASYKVGSTLVSAFSEDSTVIRAIDEHDLAVRHDFAVSVIEEVEWGA